MDSFEIESVLNTIKGSVVYTLPFIDFKKHLHRSSTTESLQTSKYTPIPPGMPLSSPDSAVHPHPAFSKQHHLMASPL